MERAVIETSGPPWRPLSPDGKQLLVFTMGNPVTLRLMTEHDLPMLHDWLNRPHIVQWWDRCQESIDA